MAVYQNRRFDTPPYFRQIGESAIKMTWIFTIPPHSLVLWSDFSPTIFISSATFSLFLISALPSSAPSA